MTVIVKEPNESSSEKIVSESEVNLSTSAQPRFNLKKRSIENIVHAPVNLCTVNSAFLSGLFGDIQMNASSGTEIQPQDISDETSNNKIDQNEGDEEGDQPSSKKTRISKTMSIARCGRSFANLSDSVPTESEGASASNGSKALHTSSFGSIDRQDSLHLQLHCVSSSSSSESSYVSSKNVADVAAQLAFPRLATQGHVKENELFPATVSIPSCAAIDPTKNAEANNGGGSIQRDCYGWFVEMDFDDRNDCERLQSGTYYKIISDLAFSAPTAPKATCHSAEVEWAKAADTVDDVLGDFF